MTIQMKATEKQFPKIIILLVKEYLMYFFFLSSDMISIVT